MSTMSRSIYQLGFEISPVILTRGIASLVPGGMVPIVAITEAVGLTAGLLNGSLDIDLDNYFAHFQPVPGSTLVNNQIGNYPFANQSVAANAIIAQPLSVSLIMDIPVNSSGGYLSKFLTMNTLKTTLDTHNHSGGTYTVATPSYIYTDCVLLSLKDLGQVSGSRQPQMRWQWDFSRPLVSLAQANQALNSMMDKLNGASAISGNPTWSGVASTLGSVVSGASSGAVTTVKNLIAGSSS